MGSSAVLPKRCTLCAGRLTTTKHKLQHLENSVSKILGELVSLIGISNAVEFVFDVTRGHRLSSKPSKKSKTSKQNTNEWPKFEVLRVLDWRECKICKGCSCALTNTVMRRKDRFILEKIPTKYFSVASHSVLQQLEKGEGGRRENARMFINNVLLVHHEKNMIQFQLSFTEAGTLNVRACPLVPGAFPQLNPLPSSVNLLPQLLRYCGNDATLHKILGAMENQAKPCGGILSQEHFFVTPSLVSSTVVDEQSKCVHHESCRLVSFGKKRCEECSKGYETSRKARMRSIQGRASRVQAEREAETKDMAAIKEAEDILEGKIPLDTAGGTISLDSSVVQEMLALVRSKRRLKKQVRYSPAIFELAFQMLARGGQAMYDRLQPILGLPTSRRLRQLQWNHMDGVSEEAVQSISKAGGKHHVLAFDAIYCRRGMNFRNGKFVGFAADFDITDFGTKVTDLLASQSLVFSIQYLDSALKVHHVPVAAFPMRHVTSSSLSICFLKVLSSSAQRGIDPRVVSCDGYAAHRKLWKVLADAKSHSVRNPFLNTEMRIIYDIAHLLKRLRNCLYSPKRRIFTPFGEASWHSILCLYNEDKNSDSVSRYCLRDDDVVLSSWRKMNTAACHRVLGDKVLCGLSRKVYDDGVYGHSDGTLFPRTPDLVSGFDAGTLYLVDLGIKLRAVFDHELKRVTFQHSQEILDNRLRLVETAISMIEAIKVCNDEARRVNGISETTGLPNDLTEDLLLSLHSVKRVLTEDEFPAIQHCSQDALEFLFSSVRGTSNANPTFEEASHRIGTYNTARASGIATTPPLAKRRREESPWTVIPTTSRKGVFDQDQWPKARSLLEGYGFPQGIVDLDELWKSCAKYLWPSPKQNHSCRSSKRRPKLSRGQMQTNMLNNFVRLITGGSDCSASLQVDQRIWRFRAIVTVEKIFSTLLGKIHERNLHTQYAHTPPDLDKFVPVRSELFPTGHENIHSIDTAQKVAIRRVGGWALRDLQRRKNNPFPWVSCLISKKKMPGWTTCVSGTDALHQPIDKLVPFFTRLERILTCTLSSSMLLVWKEHLLDVITRYIAVDFHLFYMLKKSISAQDDSAIRCFEKEVCMKYLNTRCREFVRRLNQDSSLALRSQLKAEGTKQKTVEKCGTAGPSSGQSK